MLMPGTVVTLLLHKVGTKITQWCAMVLKLVKLCKTIIVRGINLMILIVQYINNQVVQIVLKLEQLLVRYLTTAEVLIKAGRIRAQLLVGQIGQLHQIIAPKTRQLVRKVLSIGH
jgi:hypothetical protein